MTRRCATSIFVPTPSGLIQVNVRVNVPGEGPRASGKLVRWNRVQLGELAVEIQGGHRLVTFQVEAQVLSGVDESADAIAAFARASFAAVDGRTGSSPSPRRHVAGRNGGRREPTGSTTSSAAKRPTAAKSARRAAGRQGTVTPDRGVIFDLDGVLVDSEIWWDEVRAAFAAEHDRTLDRAPTRRR